MDDMILRRAAIDALYRYDQPKDNGDGTITIKILTGDGAKKVLEAVASRTARNHSLQGLQKFGALAHGQTKMLPME